MALMYAAVWVMTCAAIASVAFVYGRQIGYTNRDAELSKDKLGEVSASLERMEVEYRQLELEYDRLRLDRDKPRQPETGWNPASNRFDI